MTKNFVFAAVVFPLLASAITPKQWEINGRMNNETGTDTTPCFITVENCSETGCGVAWGIGDASVEGKLIFGKKYESARVTFTNAPGCKLNYKYNQKTKTIELIRPSNKCDGVKYCGVHPVLSLTM